jgi:hypothetical protein
MGTGEGMPFQSQGIRQLHLTLQIRLRQADIEIRQIYNQEGEKIA